MLLSRWAYYVTVASHLALTAVIAMRSGWGVAMILVLPLLIPLPGLLRGRDYTFAWATMLLVFYVGGYLAAGHANPADKWACFGVAALAALEFVSLSVYVKARSKERAFLRGSS
ncbi:MAG: DUF2069 domain-containing protein [Rhizobium sp.]|nr:MAG: DUF2069 domain-containing protein [Rhizobium sp.]